MAFKYMQAISKSTKILALCDFDAYSGRLNFVFGETYVNGSISVSHCNFKTFCDLTHLISQDTPPYPIDLQPIHFH
jgi:predicted Zn-dependent protease